MPVYHTTDLAGVSELNPDTRQMREVLAQLDGPEAKEADHPDVSLMEHGSGWAITAYASGVVTLENFEATDRVPKHIKSASRRDVLEMWLELSRGEIRRVLARPWVSPEDGREP